MRRFVYCISYFPFKYNISNSTDIINGLRSTSLQFQRTNVSKTILLTTHCFLCYFNVPKNNCNTTFTILLQMRLSSCLCHKMCNLFSTNIIHEEIHLRTYNNRVHIHLVLTIIANSRKT